MEQIFTNHLGVDSILGSLGAPGGGLRMTSIDRAHAAAENGHCPLVAHGAVAVRSPHFRACRHRRSMLPRIPAPLLLPHLLSPLLLPHLPSPPLLPRGLPCSLAAAAAAPALAATAAAPSLAAALAVELESSRLERGYNHVGHGIYPHDKEK